MALGFQDDLLDDMEADHEEEITVATHKPHSITNWNAEIVQNSELRNARHSSANDHLDLQLQPKNVSSKKAPYLSKKFADEDTKTVIFPVYFDSSLPFLDKTTEIGRQVSKSIVAADFDDDCATDDDMKHNAQKAMIRELSKGVDKFLMYSKQGHESKFIKNKQYYPTVTAPSRHGPPAYRPTNFYEECSSCSDYNAIN